MVQLLISILCTLVLISVTLLVMTVCLLEKDLISVVTAKKLLFITKMLVLISIGLTCCTIVIIQFS